MAKKAIREYNAKQMMAKGLPELTGGAFTYDAKLALVGPDTDMEELASENEWLKTTKLVVKPDQLFGKRGKNKLLLLDASWDDAKAWIGERMRKKVTLEASPNKPTGTLTHFLIEPFVPHGKEYYVAMTTGRNYDTIYFSTQGGVDIESVWDTVKETHVKILENIDDVTLNLPDDLEDKDAVTGFVKGLYKFFIDYHFTYLEINPFALEGGKIIPLDTVARVDDYATFTCAEKWGDLEFPKAFGMAPAPEEKRIEELDERTGASLKLTLLNPKGRVWNLVAGGGASVIYADTVCDLGYAGELANYGEYSGNPSTEDTYEYTKTVLDLMTREKDPEGRPKYLMVGGGIANFTDVANTFTGIIKAIEDYQEKLRECNVRIYVRRGGPNWEGGVGLFENLGERIGIHVEAHGPSYHMTRIVRDAFEGTKEG